MSCWGQKSLITAFYNLWLSWPLCSGHPHIDRIPSAGSGVTALSLQRDGHRTDQEDLHYFNVLYIVRCPPLYRYTYTTCLLVWKKRRSYRKCVLHCLCFSKCFYFLPRPLLKRLDSPQCLLLLRCAVCKLGTWIIEFLQSALGLWLIKCYSVWLA